jgi:hypothetical protein
MTTAIADRQVEPLAGTFDRQLRGVHHLVLNTDDMKKTVDFYCGVLGMPLVGAPSPPSATDAPEWPRRRAN